MGIVLTSFMLTGCMGKKLAAENMDYVLEHQIQKRLPLYSAQKVELSKDVDAFLNEQKKLVKEALPVISTIELKPMKTDDQYLYLRGIYEDLALRFSRLMSKYMAPLDQKQQKEFIKTLNDENKKISKTDKGDILKKIRNRFETLFGNMNEDQRKILDDYAEFFEQRNVQRLERRKNLHVKFQTVYAQETSKETKMEGFYELFKEYQEKAVDDEKNLELIKKVLPTLNDKQKQVFHGRVEELREILRYFVEADF